MEIESNGETVYITPNIKEIYGHSADEIYARREELWLESRETFRALVDNSPDIIMRYDAHCRIIFINPNELMKRATGIEPRDCVGKTLREVGLPSAMCDYWEGKISEVLRTAKPAFELFDIDGPNGRLTFDWRLGPEFRADGEVTGIHSTARDITAMKELQAQLLQSQKMEAIGQLTGGIAHNFNNMLQAIITPATYVLSLPHLDPEVAENVQLIEESGERAADSIRQLMMFARQNPKDMGLHIFNVKQTIEQRLKALRPNIVAQNPNIRTDTRYESDHPLVLGYASLFGPNVLTNLLLDAEHAIPPEGGTIAIEVAFTQITDSGAADRPTLTPGLWVRVRVSDDGKGMSEAVRAHALEPYFTTKEEGKGTGLGLSSALSVVQMLGGHMEFESEPGRGTVFDICLPRARSAERRSPEPDIKKGNGQQILVDDDTGAAIALQRLLSLADYKVARQTSGEGGVDYYREHHEELDLVIMDLGMAGMGGAWALTEMHAVSPRLRALILTGYAETLSEGWQGVVGPCHKPVTREFLNSVHDALEVPAADIPGARRRE